MRTIRKPGSPRKWRPHLLLTLIILLFPVMCFAADVTLQWDANTESDLVGYYVYQAERIGNKTTAWQRITPDPVTEVIFVVTGLDSNNYAWMVTAVDSEDNESFVSNMVERYDRTPPGVPANLKIGGEQ